MRVTKTAAQHVASGGPPALDIGDGDIDRDEILAPRSALVAQALTTGSANLSLDFFDEGKKWRIVLAHDTLPHPVEVGAMVAEGQVVGRMGNTSSPTMPVPIHLHIQLGWWNGSAWVWVDPWIYLRQNQENDPMPAFKSAGSSIGSFTFVGDHDLISPLDTKVRFPRPSGSTFDVLAVLNLKTADGVAVDIDGKSPPLNNRDQVYLVDAANFGVAAYALRQDGTYKAIDVAAQVQAATAPLQVEIAEQQETISSQTTRISELAGVVSQKNGALDAAILHEKPHTDLSAALQAARSR